MAEVSENPSHAFPYAVYGKWEEYDIYVQEVVLMKIVVIKSPKMLAGVLRLIFGIKKENFE